MDFLNLSYFYFLLYDINEAIALDICRFAHKSYPNLLAMLETDHTLSWTNTQDHRLSELQKNLFYLELQCRSSIFNQKVLIKNIMLDCLYFTVIKKE